MTHTVTQRRAFSASQRKGPEAEACRETSREFSGSVCRTFSTSQLPLDSMASKVSEFAERLKHTISRLKMLGVYRLYIPLLKRAFLSRDSCPLTRDKANLSTAGGNVLQPLNDF